jgi:hypothetical protein
LGFLILAYASSALFYGNIIAGPFGGTRINREKERHKFYAFVLLLLFLGVGFVVTAISHSKKASLVTP